VTEHVKDSDPYIHSSRPRFNTRFAGKSKNAGWVEPRASPTNVCVVGLDPPYKPPNGRKHRGCHGFGTPTPCVPVMSLARGRSTEPVAPGAPERGRAEASASTDWRLHKQGSHITFVGSGEQRWAGRDSHVTHGVDSRRCRRFEPARPRLDACERHQGFWDRSGWNVLLPGS